MKAFKNSRPAAAVSGLLAALARKARRFLFSGAGAVALGGAVAAVPVVCFQTAAVQTTLYASIQTRLHQSQCAAALAVAKEGEDADAQAIVEAWMPNNLTALGRPGDVAVHSWSVDDTGTQIDSAYQAKPLVAGLMEGLFERPAIFDEGVKAERYYRPLEVVVVVDGSSSTRTYVEQYKTSMKNVARTFMRGRQTADDVRISLIAFSGHMNVGVEYADKIITPESRRLYDDGTGTTYDLRAATLAAYNPALPNDLLAANGPGSTFGMACVGRKPLEKTASAAAIAAYVADIEVPPESPAEGFSLIIGDNRPIVEAGTPHTTYGQPNQVVSTYLSNNATKVDAPYGLLDYLLVPHAAINYDDLNNITAIKNWSYNDTAKWGATSNLTKSSVGIYFNCSTMPMLVGSNDIDEIEERIALYSAGWTTGGDEGLAWAIRALSPNWSEIWDKGEDYPAPYHSETQKVIFFLGDTYNNTGYPSGMTGTGPDAFTGIIQTIVDNGIELYLFIDGSMWNSTLNKFYNIISAAVPPENVFYTGTGGATVLKSLEKMEEMALRTYDVRLAENRI